MPGWASSTGAVVPDEASRAPSVAEVPSTEADDDRRWRRVLWSLPSGLYIVGSRAGQRRNLMTASWVVQVATSPRQVGVSLERASLTLELIRAGGIFTLNLLPVDERALVRRFAKPVPAGDIHVDGEGAGSMAGVRVLAAGSGAPVLAAAIGVIDCQVARIVDLGSHCFVVGRVVGVGGGEDGGGEGGGRGEGGGGGEGGGSSRGTAPPMRILAMGDTRMHYGG